MGLMRREAAPSGSVFPRQRDARVRAFLRKYRVGSLIQLGILGYVALALPYWVQVNPLILWSLQDFCLLNGVVLSLG